MYEEDYRQFEASGKVQAFVKVAFGGTAVTRVGDGNILLLLKFEAHCNPCSVQNLCADDNLWHKHIYTFRNLSAMLMAA
ncbi:hypothetical protein D3C74_442530 [compost metagenome]